MPIERKAMDAFDWIFFGALAAILGFGLLSIYSVATGASRGVPYYIKQTYWILLGVALFFLAARIDYHEIARFSYVIYAAVVGLLALVLVIGRVGMGAQRWLPLGPISLQPSEFAKVGLLLALARYFSTASGSDGLSPRQLLPPLLLVLIPIALMIKQPDLGTALASFSIFFALVFVLGVRSRFLVYTTLLSLMLFPFLWISFWGNLKTYQQERLLTFINPSGDPLGTGYHVTQSKIAIGSGGLFGKGLFGGTQSQLRFLPESHTDFIFSVFAEEWGFAGVLLLLLLFLVVILWGIDVANKAKDTLGMLIASGGIGVFSFYLMVNIGMALGIVPVVGVPLPLMSYGGTAMLTTLGLLGLLFNVKLRRFMLFY